MPQYGLFYFIRSIFSMILDQLPTVELPSDSMTVFTTIGDYAAVIGHYVPLDTFLICLSIVLSFWLICAVISAVLQIF